MKNSVWLFGSFVLVILGIFVYSAFYLPIVKSQNSINENSIEKSPKVNNQKSEIESKPHLHKEVMPNKSTSQSNINIEDKESEDSYDIEESISYVGVSTQDYNIGYTIEGKPSTSLCLKYNGIISNGDCTAKYDEAYNICQEMDGVLPNIEQLRNIVKKCGCDIEENEPPMCKNRENNNSYHACYENAGFTPFEYWSSTKNTKDDQMLVLHFYYGSVYGRYKNGYMGVRCLKSEY